MEFTDTQVMPANEEKTQEHVVLPDLRTVPMRTEPWIEGIIIKFNNGLAWTAGICLFLMMLLIVFNSVIRLFASPFAGTTEVAGWLMAITTSFALGYTQIKKGHVDIDLLTVRFSPRIQAIIQSLVLFTSLVFFLIVGWQLIIYGINILHTGTLSETMGVIFYPFIFVVSGGFLGISLVLIVDLIRIFKGGTPNGR